jgi:hypothetical protein
MRKDTQPLANWAEGKPLGVTLPAIHATSSTEDVRQFLHQRRTLTGILLAGLLSMRPSGCVSTARPSC